MLVVHSVLTRCFFSLGRSLEIIWSWCVWNRWSLGNPGMKKPSGRREREREGETERSEVRVDEQTEGSSLWRLTVHALFLIGQQLWQGPEGVLLIHEHQEQRSDLTHALTVTDLLQRRRKENQTSTSVTRLYWCSCRNAEMLVWLWGRNLLLVCTVNTPSGSHILDNRSDHYQQKARHWKK